ncbi:MAG: SIR2 family protein [Cetobacterium sp.]
MIEKKITEILKNSKAAPVLFIGSGFSRRYLELEDWKGLLKKFSDQLPYDFNYYLGKGYSKDRKENLDIVASLMTKDFYEIWWKDKTFKESRNIHSEQITNEELPLKIEISNYLLSLSNKQVTSEELNLLKKLATKQVIDTIITTNWDLFLEKQIFSSFDTYIGQDELLTSNHIGIEEIYKIHGCASNPESLILTNENYENFNKKNAYLAAKLLTTFIEHPVIFIGYSLSDKNIQDILKNIAYSLSKEYIKKIENNLIFIQPIFGEGKDFFEKDSITIDEISIPRIIFYLKDYSPIYKSLLNYERKFPVKLVKLMKNSLYEIVKSNNPQNKIIVSDIESEEDLSRSDFVIGVGVSSKLEEANVVYRKGLVGIDYIELLEDIVFNTIISPENPNKEYSKEIIDKIYSQKNYIPIFKYFYYADYSLVNLPKSKNKSYENLFLTKDLQKIKNRVINTYETIDSLLNNTEITLAMKIHYLPLYCTFKSVHILENFIVENFDKIDVQTNKSTFYKLIKILDYLKYYKKLK